MIFCKEYIGWVLLILVFTGALISVNNCADSERPTNSLNPTIVEIGEKVKNKKVVALGESSHGIGDFYHFKSELVQYLHKYHDFEVLAFESGFGDLNLAWSQIDSISGIELLDETLFWNFKCEEILGLFRYLKSESSSQNPLIYTGFDNQMSSSFFIQTIQPIVARFDDELAKELEYRLQGYVRWFRAGYYEDEEKYLNEALNFVETASRIQSIFHDNKRLIKQEFGWTDFQNEILVRTCNGFKRTVEVPYEERHLSSQHRDVIMFDNFKWLMNEVYPDKKIIIWAHNGHIERKTFYEYGFKWMGHHLHEYLGDDYYSLGLFARQGEAYRQWGDTTIVFDNDTIGMIESVVDIRDKNSSFIDLESVNFSWCSDTLEGFEIENGGVVQFVPSDRFDGILVLNEVKSPEFLNFEK